MNRLVLCCLKPGAISYYVSVPPQVPHRLAESGFDFIYTEDLDEFLKFLPQAEIIITFNFKEEWIPFASKLKWVSTNAAGRERIAEKALQAAGIEVTFGKYHGQIMSESILGMMLFVVRGLGTAYRLQKEIQWCDTILYDQVWTLRNKICVILGLGHIGLYVARLTKAFGMYNIGIKRTVTGSYEQVDQLVSMADLHQVLPRADHLVIILPKAPETNNLIGATEFALMKPSMALYNVGRGNCVNETALYQALKEERIKWACLDVFQTEPLPMDSPLRTLDNILILPHSSAFAPEYYLLYFEEFLQNFEEYCRRNIS